MLIGRSWGLLLLLLSWRLLQGQVQLQVRLRLPGSQKSHNNSFSKQEIRGSMLVKLLEHHVVGAQQQVQKQRRKLGTQGGAGNSFGESNCMA